jgi:hypothetical protein
MSESDPISWRSVIYGTPVLSADGTKVGTVREVLGSDSEDIFHGIRVAVSGHPDVMLASDNVGGMSSSAVTSDLSAAEIQAMPAFDESASYHLASVGWLRKHLGWQPDSKSDEEPG